MLSLARQSREWLDVIFKRIAMNADLRRRTDEMLSRLTHLRDSL